jgi:hypothetical protein
MFCMMTWGPDDRYGIFYVTSDDSSTSFDGTTGRE